MALLLAAALVPALVASAGSAQARSRLSRPTLHGQALSGRTVRLYGRTGAARATVRVQRRSAGRWHTVRRTTTRRHTWSVRQAQHGTAVYRAVRSTRRSRSLAVRLPAADACGTRIRKHGGGWWSCTFDDEFGGTALDTGKWMVQTNFVSGTPQAHACYTNNNVAVSGGHLNLTVRKMPAPVTCQDTAMGDMADYTAGSVMTYDRLSQQYGRFSARIKAQSSPAPGLQEDFWLWPDVRYDTQGVSWPAAGEIDVSEQYSAYPDWTIPFLHYADNDNGGNQWRTNTALCSAERGVWNTYTLTWGPDRLAIAVNGRTCLVNTSGDPAFQKRYIMALTQALGSYRNLPTDQTPMPATMQVDWVRVWK